MLIQGIICSTRTKGSSVTTDASPEVGWYRSWNYSSLFSSLLWRGKKKKFPSLVKNIVLLHFRVVTQTTEEHIESYINLLPPTPICKGRKTFSEPTSQQLIFSSLSLPTAINRLRASNMQMWWRRKNSQPVPVEQNSDIIFLRSTALCWTQLYVPLTALSYIFSSYS